MCGIDECVRIPNLEDYPALPHLITNQLPLSASNNTCAGGCVCGDVDVHTHGVPDWFARIIGTYLLSTGVLKQLC
jgi:hypothetical protein